MIIFIFYFITQLSNEIDNLEKEDLNSTITTISTNTISTNTISTKSTKSIKND